MAIGCPGALHPCKTAQSLPLLPAVLAGVGKYSYKEKKAFLLCLRKALQCPQAESRKRKLYDHKRYTEKIFGFF